MKTPALFIITLLLFSTIYVCIAGAYSTAALDSSLQRYGVQNSIISMLKPVNITYSGSQYLALYIGSNLYFTVNVSGNYSLMDNASQIYGVIKQNLLNSSLPLALHYFSQLHSLMLKYKNSSAGAINNCLGLTGLSSGYTCTAANNCDSCLHVPYCVYFYEGPGTQIAGGSGITGPIGTGIMQFESDYDKLNASFNTFLNATSGVNYTNMAYKRVSLQSALNNITSGSARIGQDALFPASNVSSTQMQQCQYYYNISLAPWFCRSIGYCGEAPTYNFSMLQNISNIMNKLSALPIAQQQLMAIAINSSNIAGRYVEPFIMQQKEIELNTILNTTLKNYSSLLNNSFSLLGHISNYSLAYSIEELQAAYANLTSNYTTINMLKANALLAGYMRNATLEYASLNSTYSKLDSLAYNNTLLLLEAQLNSRQYSGNIARLAAEQNLLDNSVMGKISNLSSTYNALLSMHSSALGVYNQSASVFSPTELARSIDSAFVKGLESHLNMSYANTVAFVPVGASLLSFIIAFIIIGAVFMLYLSLRLHRKLKLNRQTKRAWKMLFVVLILLAIIYIALTYIYAAKANSFAPLAAFDSAVHGSSYVAIFLNGTPTIQQFDCASGISKSLLGMGKKPLLVSEANGTCTVANQTKPLSYCMNGYALLSVPMIFLTNSNASSISIYSMYGSVMSYSGNSTQMSLCYPSRLLG